MEMGEKRTSRYYVRNVFLEYVVRSPRQPALLREYVQTSMNCTHMHVTVGGIPTPTAGEGWGPTPRLPPRAICPVPDNPFLGFIHYHLTIRAHQVKYADNFIRGLRGFRVFGILYFTRAEFPAELQCSCQNVIITQFFVCFELSLISFAGRKHRWDVALASVVWYKVSSNRVVGGRVVAQQYRTFGHV